MEEDDIPRDLPERTGRHICSLCLRETPADEYFANDLACRECAGKAETYPLATTPHGPKKNGDGEKS
jgi:hypothetical protein